MRLTSSAFPQGGKIPTRFTCDGDNVSPPLSWSGEPQAARSLAIVCSDPDAPHGVWFHWAVFDIPVGVTELAEHCVPSSGGPPQARNDFGKRGYGGPCPPHGHGRHHYHFTLFALDVAQLDMPSSATCREVEEAARLHALATADLVGVYAR